MEDEKLIELMNNGLLVNAADHLIFPLIKKMIDDRINLACSNFSIEKNNFIGDVAYIKALKDLENKLKRSQVEGNTAHKKLNEK